MRIIYKRGRGPHDMTLLARFLDPCLELTLLLTKVSSKFFKLREWCTVPQKKYLCI